MGNYICLFFFEGGRRKVVELLNVIRYFVGTIFSLGRFFVGLLNLVLFFFARFLCGYVIFVWVRMFF